MNLEKLGQLHNTLSLIETKGQNSILMANCLILVQEMIKQEHDELNETKRGESNDSK